MWASRALVVLVLTAPLATNAAAGDLKIDRWELTNTQFYEDRSATAPAGQKLYRLKRAAAADEGAERCATEWQESVTKKKEFGPFCKALFTEIAPTFRVVLRSGETGVVVLEDIDVEVKNASVLKGGHGFFADEAYYDLFIKAAPGQSSTKMRQPLKFTGLGTVELRLGFDLSPLGPSTPAGAIEFVLSFEVDGGNGTASAKTALIRIEL
jgi:hypothetical protein